MHPGTALRGSSVRLVLAVTFLAAHAVAQAPAHRVVSGTVRDTTGAPVAGAEVFVGLHRVADPRAPAGCEDGLGQLLALSRSVSDSTGRYAATLPSVREEPGANCVVAWAALWRRLTRWGERPVAHALWKAVPLSARGVSLDLVLTPLAPLRTQAGGRGSRFRRQPDDEWAEVAAERVPGFAGFILEGCNIVVYLTERGREDAATDYVRARFEGRPGGRAGCASPMPIVFRRAAYDFAELRGWFEQVGMLMGLQGVTSLDIAEGINRINVGVVDSAAVRRVWRALATTDVPAEAVVVEPTFHGRAPEPPRFGPATPKLGVRLAPHYNAITPAWSADSREIVFQALEGGPGVSDYTVRAVDVDSRRVRRLASVVGRNSGRNALQVTAAGEVFFALTDSGARRLGGDVLYRTPSTGGVPERVVEDLAWPRFAVSANGRRVAVVLQDSTNPRREAVTISDLVSRDRWVVRVGGLLAAQIISLSPEGTRLAYTLGSHTHADSGGIWLYSIAAGEPQRIVPIRPLPDATQQVGGLRWVGESPHVLVVERTPGGRVLALTVVDGLRGTRRRLGVVPSGDRLPWTAAWSDDGRRVALWIPVATGPESCSPDGVCIGRRVLHFKLYVFDTATSSSRVIAEYAADEGPHWVAFSPDGRWLAYSRYGDIRVHRM